MERGEAVLFIVQLGLIIDFGVYRMRGYSSPPERRGGRGIPMPPGFWTRTVGEWHMMSVGLGGGDSPDMVFPVALNPLGDNGTIGYHQITPIKAPISQFQGPEFAACFGLNAPHLPDDLPVRLVDENGRVVPKGPIMRGKLEVLHNGTWGSVCDDMFDGRDAQVVCNMLGGNGMNSTGNSTHYRGYPYHMGSYQFRSGSGSGNSSHGAPIHMDDLNCVGDEESLLDCPPYVHGDLRLGDHNCGNIEDVGMTCSVFGPPPEAVVPTTVGPYQGTYRGDARIRLVDERDRFTNQRGRIQIQIDGVWGSVCDDMFGQEEMNVACRSLGYRFGTFHSTPMNRRVVGTEPIWLDDLSCTGGEGSLLDCAQMRTGGQARSALGRHDCSHGEDVHVACTNDDITTTASPHYPGGSNYSGPSGPFDLQSGSGALRLVDESGRQLRLLDGQNGRLQIQVNGEWGSICDDGFDRSPAATVACRQLSPMFRSGTGYSYWMNKPQQPFPGERIWLDDLLCNGNEDMLLDCRSTANGYEEPARNTVSRHNCGNQEDIGLICSTNYQPPMRPGGPGGPGPGYPGPGPGMTSLEVRLVDGNRVNRGTQGRVEVRRRGPYEEWGTVCDDNFGVEEAQVVCRMLGFESEGATPKTHAYFGRGRGMILLDDLQCTGNEASLVDCGRRDGPADCDHREDAGVICRPFGGHNSNESLSLNCGPDSTQGDVRLVGANEAINQGYGRVEVCHDGQWGSVCDDRFDDNDAGVVCVSFGYPRRQGRKMLLAEQRHTEGYGQIHLDDVQCVGTETRLDQCPSRIWGNHDCQHSEDIGVDCRPEGRAEIGEEVTISRCALYPTDLGVEQNIPVGCPQGRRCVPDRLFCATLNVCTEPFGWCTPV